jgi:hypothetical protein
VDEGESEIGGGKNRQVQRRAARGSDKAKPKRRSFTEKRRQAFLDHFAASCNAAAAARAVQISENCVYAWRKKDARFGAGWKAALDQGYARLEAGLVLEANRVLKPRAKKRAVRVGDMDAKTALAVLEAYRRSGGRAPGEVWPHPYDAEEVRLRLEKKMRLLGLLDDEPDGDHSTAPRSSGRVGPSGERPASGRSPGNPGEGN